MDRAENPVPLQRNSRGRLRPKIVKRWSRIDTINRAGNAPQLPENLAAEAGEALNVNAVCHQIIMIQRYRNTLWQ